MTKRLKGVIPYCLRSILCALCSMFIFAACATPEDVGKVQWEMNELKADVKDIKQRSQALERQKPGQDEQLNKRLSGLENEQKATSNAVSDLLIKVQSLTTELKVLTGRFEESRYFSEKSSKELVEGKDTLIAKVKELEVTVNNLNKKLADLETTKVPAEKQKPAEEVKDFYMEAYKAYKANDFEGAREKFKTILKNYPESEYSDNSRFWIAESYYKEKNYEDAILAYEELIKKNSGSDKIPGAMLKQGLAFYELNDKKTGKIVLEKLIEKFPDSEEAQVAKQKLIPPAPPAQKKPASAKKKQ